MQGVGPETGRAKDWRRAAHCGSGIWHGDYLGTGTTKRFRAVRRAVVAVTLVAGSASRIEWARTLAPADQRGRLAALAGALEEGAGGSLAPNFIHSFQAGVRGLEGGLSWRRQWRVPKTGFCARR